MTDAFTAAVRLLLAALIRVVRDERDRTDENQTHQRNEACHAAEYTSFVPGGPNRVCAAHSLQTALDSTFNVLNAACIV